MSTVEKESWCDPILGIFALIIAAAIACAWLGEEPGDGRTKASIDVEASED